MAANRAIARYSHSGICVTDLGQSREFYVNALGFAPASPSHIGAEYSALLGVERDLDLNIQMLTRDGLTIELLEFSYPRPVGEQAPREMYRLGLAHLSFNVDDIDDAVALAERWGGRAIDGSRATFALPDMSGDIVFVTDPDGTRIELMCFPSDPVLD